MLQPTKTQIARGDGDGNEVRILKKIKLSDESNDLISVHNHKQIKISISKSSTRSQLHRSIQVNLSEFFF